jgi:hypothetical protein
MLCNVFSSGLGWVSILFQQWFSTVNFWPLPLGCELHDARVRRKLLNFEFFVPHPAPRTSCTNASTFYGHHQTEEAKLSKYAKTRQHPQI